MLALLLLAGPQVRIDAVGDVMLARWVGRRIERLGPPSMLKGVRSEFQKADFVYGNLECALTNRPIARPKLVELRADPKEAPALKGFSVLSLVNNHSADCGPPGVLDAANRLSRLGIKRLQPGLKPVFLHRRGITIGFLGLIDLPGYFLELGWDLAITAARKRCDVLCVGIHWGVEGSAEPSADQISMASTFASLGVDVVLGCHPHVLQPIRELKGPNGRKCLVAFSLGNFVFDARPGAEAQSEILSLYRTQSTVYRVSLPAAARS